MLAENGSIREGLAAHRGRGTAGARLLTVAAVSPVLVVALAGVARAGVPASGTLAVAAGSTSHGTPTPGPATSSKLSYPWASAPDASGDFFIADTYNDVIEKVDPQGVMTIFAGNGSEGSPTAGTATSSDLDRPAGIAVDASGDVYFADTNSNQVLKVTAQGVLSIFAGSGSYGAPIPGPATSSKLSSPYGIAVDSAGDVFIGDVGNHEVEKVDTHGVLSVVAGTGTAGTPTAGPATSSKISSPYGLAADSAGDLFIADTNNELVEEVDTHGVLSVVAGTGTSGAPTPGPATSSDLASPYGVAVDSSGDLFIADTSNNRVDEVSPDHVLTVVAGTGTAGPPTPGPAANSTLSSPFGVAVDPSGDLYIADSYNSDIEVIGAPGTTAASLPEARYAALLILVAVPGALIVRRRRRGAARG